MEYLLIFISFILHIITFIVLRHFYLKQQAYQSEQHKFELEKKELEQLLMSYLIEMKEENDRLLAALKKNGNKGPKQSSSIIEPKPLKQNQKANVSGERYDQSMAEEPLSSQTYDQENEQVYTPLVDDIPNQQEVYKKSYQAEIIERFEQGESPADIAKALNRGKTEVELIIKFQKK